MIGQENEVNKVIEFLARTLQVKRNSQCFCGNGKKFKNCCGFVSGERLIFIEKGLNIATAYKDSKHGLIKSIPRGIWKEFEKVALNRLSCVYFGCREKPINSHLIPENVLRIYFGGHCNEFSLDDQVSSWQFIKTGIGKAGVLPVFCVRHDNDLFKSIDRPDINFDSVEQLFLLALRAVAFSFRRTQYLLGIDSQIEIIRPFLIQSRGNLLNGSHVTLDISQLHEQYIRFVVNSDFLKHALKAYEKQEWNFFSNFYRCIPYTGSIFFGGFLNPSHDLKGLKLNRSGDPIAIACNVLTRDGMLHVILSCPDDASKRMYRGLLTQLGTVNSDVFITVLNNLLTLSSDKPLISETISFSDTELEKIGALQTLAGECLRSSDKILDLKNSEQAIKFIL